MPSAFTEPVLEGCDFPSFVWRCVRAMSVAIMQRDEPLDTPARAPAIDSWHSERAAECEARRAELLALPDEEIAQTCRRQYDAALRAWEREYEQTQVRNKRLQDMIAQVTAWLPPTPDHAGLKEFMLTQLQETLRFDGLCGPKPTLQDAAAWRRQRLTELAREADLYREQARQQRERALAATAWLESLERAVPRRLPNEKELGR